MYEKEFEVDDSDSIMIRLRQIEENGKVSITNETISVSYEFSDYSSSFSKETIKYKRIITYDELVSIDLAIGLFINSNRLEKDEHQDKEYDEKKSNAKEKRNKKYNLYTNYQECFAKSKEIQKKIQILRKYGKTFVYENFLFFDLNKDEEVLSSSLDTLISNFCTFVHNQQNQPEYPPFLSLDNLLYFGSLLQRRKKNKIQQIIGKMFCGIKYDIINKAYNEAIKNKYIKDPIKSSIKMFSIIYKELSPCIKERKRRSVIPHTRYDNKFEKLQKELLVYFLNHNFLVIKVNTPVETLHVLNMIITLLYDSYIIQYFYENFFCYEDSDIESYFSDFERVDYQIQTPYSFIIHPEFLSTKNQNILKEKIISRITPIQDMNLQKYVIITSSSDFIYGKPPNDLNEDEIFKLGETSMKVNANILRDYIGINHQFYFSVQISQSLKAGNGKSTFINKKIEEIKEKYEYTFQIFHHFISDGNQRIPIESFNCASQSTKNIIHFQFNDKIMQQSIKFWSYLYQLYIYGFVLHVNDEPFLIEGIGNNLVFFEIPQIRKEHQPLKSLSEFPLPISSHNYHECRDDYYDSIFIFKGIININETICDSIEFNNDKIIKKYYLSGIKTVVEKLKKKTKKEINNLKEYIELMYYRIFNITEKQQKIHISFRKLGYIEEFFHEYTKLYTNSNPIPSNDKDAQDHFTVFFYLLTVSSFYAYGCLPNDTLHGNGLTFVTVNDLFNDQVENSKKKIHFYTTKSQNLLFKPFENLEIDIQEKYFTVCFNYTGTNPLPQDVLNNIFCSSKDYSMKIIQSFKEKNPQSYISRMQITLPSLFRSSILLSRIFLSQPIILSGDTGCGKTYSLMQLFEYFQLPINDKMQFLNIEVGKTLNCHDGITKKDVIKHLEEAPKKRIIFIDELNTSPASSYIEHIFLNGYKAKCSKFVFIGAINPWKKKNPISSKLTEVGIAQYIKGEEEKINLIEDISKNKSNKTSDNISDMMYHVYQLQESTQDIIFDFNPICYQEEYKEEDKLYPKEEQESIYFIIDNLSHIQSKQVLNKLKKSVDICIVFIRQMMNERAVISYRDIERMMIIYNELYNYCIKYEDEEMYNEILPMVTIIISFVLRLPNKQEIKENDLDTEDQKCSKIFQTIFKKYFPKGDKYGLHEEGIYKINLRDKLISLLSIFGNIDQIKKNFMTFVYQYTLEYLKQKSILKFQSTFIHIFVMDICIRCKVPCFIIGMPGTSKSYAVELLKKQNGPNLHVNTYMSSRISSVDGIKSQYYDSIFQEIMNTNDEKEDIYNVVFIDGMGNANINPTHPLKFLHGILDHGLALNETGNNTKVATIGASEYTIDFANMNRGILVYTDLPDPIEILTVFSIEDDKINAINKTTDEEEFINYREKIKKDKIKRIFDYLWPSGIPIAISLRSFYNMRYLIDNKNCDVHSVCQILRELFNSKRLSISGNYKELMLECPKNVRLEKYEKINNLACFLERVTCIDTRSHKSLSLFTKNYEAIEYFNLFKDDNFIRFLENQFDDDKNSLTFEKGMFKNFKYQLFAEDFDQSPEQISQYALNKIIKCIPNKNENILFIGNHPCFDSCLDLLNVPYGEKQVERDVIIGTEFSFKFKLTNTNFYIMMIANIDELHNTSASTNPFSFAFLDRTEVVYLDWEMIGEYYLKYKFDKMSNIKQTIKEISEILDKHAKYGIKSDNFHSSIQSLYNKYRRGDINLINRKFKDELNEIENEYLQNLIEERWEKGIKSVILTKSKIFEKIYLPTKIKKESIFIENDSNILNFKHLKSSIKKLQGSNEKLIIIKCSTFDKLHFTHLKSFFDNISESSNEINYNIFIIYYGLDPKEFEGLSTFRWPIFAMDDISIHPELESKLIKVDKNSSKTRKRAEEIVTEQVKQSEIEEIIKILNNMNIKTTKEIIKLCNNFFHNIFDEVIKFTEKDIGERSHDDYIDIKKHYDISDFKQECNFFEQIKTKFDSDHNNKYFNICIDTTSFNSSIKSQLILQVYNKLCDILPQFLLFRFGSSLIEHIPGESNIEDYLFRSRYLDLPFNAFLKKPDSDVFYYLFMDFLDFLINNKASFDEDMIKRKSIADRLICAMNSPIKIKEIFNDLYHSQYRDKFKQKANQFIFEPYEEFDKYDYSNNQPIYLQQYVDYLHFRSIAGLNINNHQTNYYWDNYLNDCIFSKQRETNDVYNERRDQKKLNRSTIIKSIIEYRNKSIFEIFVLPIESDRHDVFESDICEKLIRIDNFETTLERENNYRIAKKFNENTESLKSENRINELTRFASEENKKIIQSMEIPYAISKWDGDQTKDVITKFKRINDLTLDDIDIEQNTKYEKIKEINITASKFTNFGIIWKLHYNNLEWSFKSDCLIDEIQSILNKGSTKKAQFRKWLFSGFQSDEPLSIIAFRRYLTSQDEYETDFAKVLDPFFGDVRIIKLFVNYIEDKIPEKNSFPIGEITDDFDYVFDEFSYHDIYRFSTNDELFRIYLDYPYLAQFVWFHVTFNKPSNYPLITLLIQKSAFFIDFQVLPKIIYSIVHLRHIFSYNPVFIPIILQCTSLFDDCECKLLLYSLNYFDSPNKEFENIQEELGELKEFLKQKYPKSYEILRKRSSYDQLEFILKIYYKEYNEIVEKIHEHSNKRYKNNFDEKLNIIDACDILPNMLLTNATLTNFILPILHETEFKLYNDVEEEICRIFTQTECIKSFDDTKNVFSSSSRLPSFPLFKVSYENENNAKLGGAKVDFLGFSKIEYQNLFQHYLDISSNIIIKTEKLNCYNNSLNFHASILSFFHYLYLDKTDDDTSEYCDIKDVNDISRCHLNTYSNNKTINDRINYDLHINAEGIIINKNKLSFSKTIYYEENKMYPLQGIFKLLPVELRNQIREYQNKNRNGFQLIQSEEELNKEDEELSISLEEEVYNNFTEEILEEESE